MLKRKYYSTLRDADRQAQKLPKEQSIINVRLPTRLKNHFKRQAKKHNKTLSVIIVDYLYTIADLQNKK